MHSHFILSPLKKVVFSSWKMKVCLFFYILRLVATSVVVCQAYLPIKVINVFSSIYGANRLAEAASNLRQCARCLMTIGTNELVMRARCFLYHLECFKCVICDVALIKGDLFGMMDAVVYCQHHFRQQQEHHFEEFAGGHPYYGYDEAAASTSFGGMYNIWPEKKLWSLCMHIFEINIDNTYILAQVGWIHPANTTMAELLTTIMEEAFPRSPRKNEDEGNATSAKMRSVVTAFLILTPHLEWWKKPSELELHSNIINYALWKVIFKWTRIQTAVSWKIWLRKRVWIKKSCRFVVSLMIDMGTIPS